jgi:hypothetical protein
MAYSPNTFFQNDFFGIKVAKCGLSGTGRLGEEGTEPVPRLVLFGDFDSAGLGSRSGCLSAGRSMSIVFTASQATQLIASPSLIVSQ